MADSPTTITGTILDSNVTLTLGELCRACAVDVELVIEIVEEGVVEPAGRRPEEWRFDGEAVQRIQRALRLAEDLRVNLPGVALALELMDELEDLRAVVSRSGAGRP